MYKPQSGYYKTSSVGRQACYHHPNKHPPPTARNSNTNPPRADSQTLNVFSLQQPLRIPYCSSSNCIELSLSLHRIMGSRRRRSSQISLQESRGFFSQSRCSKTIKTTSPSLLFLLLLVVLHISPGSWKSRNTNKTENRKRRMKKKQPRVRSPPPKSEIRPQNKTPSVPPLEMFVCLLVCLFS